MDLLTSKQSEILDLLCSMTSDYQKFDEFAFYNHPLCAGMQYDSIAEICRSLEEEKYIRDLNIDTEETVRFLVVTHKGRNYKEYQRIEKRERWKERFCGAIVTLIIWAIKELTVWLLQPPIQ